MCAMPVPAMSEFVASHTRSRWRRNRESARARSARPGRPTRRQCSPTDIIIRRLLAFAVEQVEGVFEIAEKSSPLPKPCVLMKRMSLDREYRE